MAAALLTRQIQYLADPVEVSSAGVLDGGRAVPDGVLQAMAPYGIDLSGHSSQSLTTPMLQGSDLIIGMGRRHLHEAVLLDPPCWPQAFTLRELIRRGEEVGTRRPDQGIRSWIESVQGDRTRASLVHRAVGDEIADPYGRSLDHYRSTAAELDQLTARLAGLLWPDEVRHPA
jgi:protein-tyrosine-phosphatase